MLKIDSYDIVFQEVPNQTTLALNLTCCPHRCPGCHSPHLWADAGEVLTDELLLSIIGKYRSAITCLCFMGGDNDTERVLELAGKVHALGFKTAWYSGNTEPPYPLDSEFWKSGVLDYLKLGPWIAERGMLKAPDTNQRFYTRTSQGWIDTTFLFRKK